jgi:hypothetical protein
MPITPWMQKRTDMTSPITDPGEAQSFDLSSRVVRALLLVGGTQWLFVAALLGVRTSLPLAAVAAVALAGIAYTLAIVRYFARLHRARLVQFIDPVTGELSIPAGRLPMPRRVQLGRWALVLGQIAVVVWLSTTPDSGPASTSLRPGQWTATGKVVSALNVAGNPAARVLKRPWTFTTVCEPSCRTMFLRQTLDGPSETVLIARHGFYAASFTPVKVRCVHPAGSSDQLFDSYTLRWSSNTRLIFALEQQRGVGSCPSAQTTSWTAARTDPHAPALAPGP